MDRYLTIEIIELFIKWGPYNFGIEIENLLRFEIDLKFSISEMNIFCDAEHILLELVDCVVIAVDNRFEDLRQVLLGHALIEEFLFDVLETQIDTLFKFFNTPIMNFGDELHSHLLYRILQ